MATQDVEELDYDIHFPPPTEAVEPVVVLIGWAGCRDTHLAKYSAIYEQRCITIRYIAPMRDIFRPWNLKPYALKLLEVITDLSLEENPILFHVFSNGGGGIYRFISESVSSKPGVNVVGCIFDSFPARQDPMTVTRAFLASSRLNIFVNYFIGFFVYVYSWARNLVMAVTGSSWMSLWDYTYSEPVRWPCLYLYSKADKITDYVYVEKIIDHRKQIGADIESVCWEDSAHVSHLRKHTVAYINQCQGFLDYCLNKNTEMRKSRDLEM